MASAALTGRVAHGVLDPRRWQALALLCGAFFRVLLDGTITLVALPSIEAGLGFVNQDLQWVLSAYALTFGGLLLLAARPMTPLSPHRHRMRRPRSSDDRCASSQPRAWDDCSLTALAHFTVALDALVIEATTC